MCAACLKKKPYFDKAISAFRYDDFSKNIVLKFKHNDATYICSQLSTWIYRLLKNESADIIIPVPIHFLKRLKRKYNQSELIAKELMKLSGIPYEPRILKKIKRTSQQEGLSRKQRLKNINGSFGIDARYDNLLNEKNIILVDDVLTTGSTANECSKVLKKHGVSKVIVLTLARVEFLRSKA